MSAYSNPEYGGIQANREYFDGFAKKYDDFPQVQKLTDTISDAIKAAQAFDPESSVVMDFACGTGEFVVSKQLLFKVAHYASLGLISRRLIPHVKQIVGVDVSEAMVAQFNEVAAKEGIPVEKMRAVCEELKGEDRELDNQKFDVIVVGRLTSESIPL